MAGPLKKRAVESDGSNKQQQQPAEEQIEVDFEGRNPESQDYHGIKQLLGQLLLKAHIDISQISDMLIAQNGIGSVLKQSYDEDDDDEEEDDNMTDTLNVFGITSVLNITSHKETPCVQQLLNLLNETCEKHAEKETLTQMKQILSSSSKIGWLINERIVNIPAKISDPLLSSLNDEITRMGKRDSSYNFDYFISICKLHKPKDGGEILFANGEEEIFDREAVLKYEFDVSSESDVSVGGKWNGKMELIPYRRVLFIKASDFPKIVQSVRQYVA